MSCIRSLLLPSSFIRIHQAETDDHPVRPFLGQCTLVLRLLRLFLEKMGFDLLRSFDLAEVACG